MPKGVDLKVRLPALRYLGFFRGRTRLRQGFGGASGMQAHPRLKQQG